MKITVIGAGYVGLTTAVGLAKLGHDINIIEIDAKKVEKIMNEKKAPIYEEGVDELLAKFVPRKISATTSYEDGITKFEPDVIFICVGTPSRSDGSIDLTYLKEAILKVGNAIRTIKKYVLIVIKSTVIPGTTEKIVTDLLESSSEKKAGIDFGVTMNPEFLREGKALNDFLNPDRIVIGYKHQRDFEILKEVYKDIKKPILGVSITTAEMIKYASNAFLAAKISFINEIGNICKKLNIDVYDVAKGMGLDHRISPYFLNAGIGFGGSCFPKDLKAIIDFSKSINYDPILLESVLKVNEKQPLKLVEIALEKLGTLKGKKVVVLGLAFKPGTDDMREAPSIKVINKLIEEGANIIAYDPAAIENAKKIFKDKIKYAEDLKSALKESNIVFILTEWDDFKNIDIYKGKIVFDGRRTLNPNEARKVCTYEGVCW